MSKSRKFAPEYRRSTMEYVLMALIAGLFMFGVWAYYTSNKEDDAVSQEQAAYEPGTPEEIDNLVEEDASAEQAAEVAQDEAEYTSSSALEGAADSMGGVFDETAF